MPGRLFHRPKRFLTDQRGAVSVTLVLMLIPLIALLGIATEGSSWFLTKRAMQNAADSASMAAATNTCGVGDTCHTTGLQPTFVEEAAAVSKAYGFTDGVSHTTVATVKQGCPADNTQACYWVRITRVAPINLMQFVGFRGDVSLSAGGARGQTIAALAVARGKGKGVGDCVTALGTASNAIDLNGGASGGNGNGNGGAISVDFGGCDFYAPNGGASCTNQIGTTGDIGISEVLNPGSPNKLCGTERPAPVTPPFTDPYAGLNTTSNIPPANPANCPAGTGSYPKANNQGVVAAANQLNGSMTFSTSSPKCGDVALTGNVIVTSDSVLLINNGNLDLGTYKLNTASGAHLTIIFSGTSGNFGHTVIGSGTLDYSAPTVGSGTWSGVAMYQNPNLTTGVNLTYSGSNPDFNISGLIYAPNSSVTVSGAIDHATAGLACLAFFVKTFHIGGTISIFAQPTIDCDRQGLPLREVPGTQPRQALVQ
jgi:hypothetical protein